MKEEIRSVRGHTAQFLSPAPRIDMETEARCMRPEEDSRGKRKKTFVLLRKQFKDAHSAGGID